MSDDARIKFLEKIIEVNYYLTNAILSGNYQSVVKHRAELDSLIAFMLENKK